MQFKCRPALSLLLPGVLCALAAAVFAQQRSARANNLISFNAVGHDVGLGLNVEMPFIRVPVGRHVDKGGQPVALLNVNVGAVATSVIIAGGGLLVGYLLKTLGLQGPGRKSNHKHIKTGQALDSGQKTARQLDGGGDDREEDDELQRRFAEMLSGLRVVYSANTTGERVRMTMPQLVNELAHTFAVHDVDLPACLWQTICTVVRQAQENMRLGRASALQQIVDGVSQMPWLLAALRDTAVAEAVQAGSAARPVDGGDGGEAQCALRYASCQWSAPEQKIYELLRTHVRFT